MSLDPWTRRTCLALFLLVAGGRMWMVSAVDSDLPHWDQWFAEFGAIVGPLGEGTFAIRDLALPHNEHLVLFPRLLSASLLVASSRWEPLDEAIVSALVRAACLCLVFVVLTRRLSSPARATLALLLAAYGALPIGTFNLLSGFQVQFFLAEALAVAALWFLFSGDLEIEHFAIGSALLLIGLFNMATPLLTAASAGVLLLLRSGTGSEDRRSRDLAAAFCLFSLAAWIFWGTRHLSARGSGARDLSEFASTLLSLLSWPTPRLWIVAAMTVVPLALFAVRFRKRPATRADWFVAAIGLSSLLQVVAIALARTDAANAFSQYRDGLWFRLVIGFLLLDVATPPRDSSRVSRSALAWAAIVFLGMTVDATQRGAAELRAIREGSAVSTPRLRRALASGDFADHVDEQYAIARAIAARDISFLNDPQERFAVPGIFIDRLKNAPRHFVDLMPARLVGARPAPVSRGLRALAAAGPLWLLGGLVLLGLRLREAVRAN